MKRFSFLLLCLFSCGIVYFLVYMSWLMTLFMFDGDTSILRWAAVVSISAVVLFLLLRTTNRAYQILWKEQNHKEKSKIKNFERLEMGKVEETEIFSDESKALEGDFAEPEEKFQKYGTKKD